MPSLLDRKVPKWSKLNKGMLIQLGNVADSELMLDKILKLYLLFTVHP